jgi:hypothetical protein
MPITYAHVVQSFSAMLIAALEACNYGYVNIGPTAAPDITPKYTIVDHLGNAINASFPLRLVVDQCNVPVLEELSDALDITLTRLDEARSVADLARGMSTMNLLSAAEGVAGCMDQINSMVKFGEALEFAPGVRECSEEFGTPEWYEDPCCNWMLASTECCALRDVEVNQTVITATVEEAIMECKQERIDDVKSALISYQSFYNDQKSTTEGCNASKSKLTWE